MKLRRSHKVLIGIAAAASAVALVALHSTPAPAPVTENTPVPVSTLAGPDYLYPNRTLTGGLTNPDIDQSNISANICNPSWSTKSIRPPVSYTSPLKQKQIASGYTYHGDTNTADYELDHLISLELGGNPTDEQNLWPEPYHTQVNGVEIGAHQKDTVENELHKEVCAGTITLAQAQSEVVGDWYAVYLSITGASHAGAVLESTDIDDN